MPIEVILVDKNDLPIGSMEKVQAHLSGGNLHRAFSLFIRNSEGEFLLQKRAPEKMLWPNHWSNSCCSHPQPGEKILDAGARRTQEELGMTVSCERLYSFEYREEYHSVGVEHELCHVLLAHSDHEVKANPEEVSDFAWLRPEEISRRVSTNPEAFTPWFKMEWSHLTQSHERQIN